MIVELRELLLGTLEEIFSLIFILFSEHLSADTIAGHKVSFPLAFPPQGVRSISYTSRKGHKRVPGQSKRYNPGDIPSQGMNSVELSLSEQWVNGPRMMESIEPKFGTMPEKCSKEMKNRVSHSLLVNCNPTSIGNILQCQNFSSLERLRQSLPMLLMLFPLTLY